MLFSKLLLFANTCVLQKFNMHFGYSENVLLRLKLAAKIVLQYRILLVNPSLQVI